LTCSRERTKRKIHTRHQSDAIVPRGDGCVDMSHRYLEILDFMHFFKHMVFTLKGQNVLEKSVQNEIHVSVGIELVVVDRSSNGVVTG